MRKNMIRVIVAVMLFALSAQTVFANVLTTDKTEGFASAVYVAGSADNYPIEFYDEEKKEYCGIIPDMLKLISERAGVDFVYINGAGADKLVMGENLQADIVSLSSSSLKPDGYKDYLELVSVEKDGAKVSSGLAFTKVIDDATISSIKTAASGISGEAKNGIYLAYAVEKVENDYLWWIIGSGILVLLIAVIVLLILYIRRVRRENAAEKMIDSETGMGNLEFFKYHFRYSISDISRSLYYVAYIILDSSYLRSYYGESSFADVLKYTSSILSDFTGDREISARITENGFAFAYQAINDEDAQKRITEVVNKLNNFENMKEQSDKLVFHAALYHLENSDKNCEILIFNLRKNCNRIFGTETEVILCDTYSMNLIQEEKKITESILKGLDNNEFKMYLQFVVDGKSKKIISAEALSRWDSPEKGLITPNKYISDMETAGLISRHDFCMFEHVCRQLEKWKGTEFGDIVLSCNFTRITLSEANFIDKLKTISRGFDFDKSLLAIEITEDAIEKDRKTVAENVMKCKELGFRVYLDDLGSGYTSLANLCDYPIDVVKIDRDILLKAKDEKAKALFGGIIALAHSLDIKVLCEGVETEEQNEFVLGCDCDLIQGWYYSKVIPLEECESFIKSR